MLLDLMRKDLLLNRKGLILNYVVSSGFLLFMAHVDDVGGTEYAFVSSLILSFATLTILVREDKFKAAALSCCLPVSRARIVQARYLLGIGMGLLGAAGALLLVPLLPTATVPRGEVLQPSVLLTSVTTIVVATAILIPFTVRFGLMGILIFLVSTQVLGVLVLGLFKLTGSGVDLKGAVRGAVEVVTSTRASLGEAGYSLAVVFALVLLSAISCHASRIVFERKEL